MRVTDDIDSLIEIIGKNRSSSSPEEVAEAEEKLRQAVAGSRVRSAKTAKTVGTLVAALGFITGIWPVILIPEIWDVFSELGLETDPVTFAERAFPLFFLLMMVFQIVLGLTLAVGGIGFRMLRQWGRRAILAVIWIYITYCIFAFVYFEVSVLFSISDVKMRLPMVLGGFFVTAFWVFLLWLAQRYFISQRIKNLCR